MENGIALPGEYQKVDYIESTGTQFIITDFIPDITSAMYCRMAITSDSNSEKNCQCGCVLDGNRGWFCVGKYSNQGLRAIFSTVKVEGAMINFDNNFHDFFIANGKQKIDNVLASHSINTLPALIPVYIFRSNTKYAFNGEMYMKVSKCRLWKDGILHHDFIPCLRIRNEKPGLYDVVTGEFFTNDGTSEFLYG